MGDFNLRSLVKSTNALVHPVSVEGVNNIPPPRIDPTPYMAGWAIDPVVVAPSSSSLSKCEHDKAGCVRGQRKKTRATFSLCTLK